MKNTVLKAACIGLSVVPLSIAFIEAILVRTQFFGVFSGTPNNAWASQTSSCLHVLLASDTALHRFGVLLRFVCSGRNW